MLNKLGGSDPFEWSLLSTSAYPSSQKKKNLCISTLGPRTINDLRVDDDVAATTGTPELSGPIQNQLPAVFSELHVRMQMHSYL
jgi:hypothetical protein